MMEKMLKRLNVLLLILSLAIPLNAAVISVNLLGADNNSMSSAHLAGAPGVRVGNWNNYHSSGPLGDEEDVFYDNGCVVGGGFRVTITLGGGGTIFSDRNHPAGDFQNDPQMFRNVIDERGGQNSPSATVVTGIPFDVYDVYVYMRDDGANRIGGFRIGQTTYYARGGMGNPDNTGAGYVLSSNAAYGSTTADFGQGNYVVFRGLRGNSFTLETFGVSVSGVDIARNKWTGFQIVSETWDDCAAAKEISGYTPLDGDLNDDCYVNMDDLNFVAAQWLGLPADWDSLATVAADWLDSTALTESQVNSGFVHPGGLFKRSDLERMRYQVQAGIDPWLTSFNQLNAESRASFNYTVQGNPNWTVVSRDPCTNCNAYKSDVTAAYLNALMWAITGDTRHAAKCVEIFNVWKNITEVTGGGTESLNAGLFIWKMLESAEIIQSTYSGWSASDIQMFKDMLVYPGYSAAEVPAAVTNSNGSFYWRIYKGDPGRHGNQDMIAWRAMMTMGVFLDNRIMYDRALNYFKGLPARPDDISYQSGPPNNSSPIADYEYWTEYRLNSWGTAIPNYGYNGVLEHYFWENGQCQESSRDQAHTFFGLSIAAGIAEVAWNQGDGVWNALDKRLMKGFEFTARYNTSYLQSYSDQPTPWEPTVASGEFFERLDRTGRWFSKKINPYNGTDYTRITRGNFPGTRPAFEQGVAHFQVRMGDQALWTERARDVAIALSGYEKTGWEQDHPGWGALCFRRPEGCAGDPISGFSNGLPVFRIPVIPTTIQAANFDYFPVNGNARTYYDTTSGNAGQAYRTSQDVDIEVCSEGGYAVTDMENGEWLSYTVFVPTSGSYKIVVRYAAVSGDGKIKLSFGGGDATDDVALPATGGFTDWADYTVSGSANLTKGVQSMRVYESGTSNTYKLKSITIVP
jgi:hypothetical protein